MRFLESSVTNTRNLSNVTTTASTIYSNSINSERSTTIKNTQAKTVSIDKPYEIWQAGGWEWRVLKKYQADDNKEYARWYCAVKSPFTYDSYEYGDTYVSEIKNNARRIA